MGNKLYWKALNDPRTDEEYAAEEEEFEKRKQLQRSEAIWHEEMLDADLF